MESLRAEHTKESATATTVAEGYKGERRVLTAAKQAVVVAKAEHEKLHAQQLKQVSCMQTPGWVG